MALPVELVRLHSKCKGHTSSPSKLQITKLLHDRISSCSEIFLVVDAFDVLSDLSRHNLIAVLETFQPILSILVTSRYLEHIRAQPQGLEHTKDRSFTRRY